MLDALFNKGKIGNCEIKNRLVVTAMVTNYCNNKGEATERKSGSCTWGKAALERGHIVLG